MDAPLDIWNIAWENRENGRKGVGTNDFTFKEAQRIAEELNQDYPKIGHWPVRSNKAWTQSNES